MKARKTPSDFFMGYDSAQDKMDAVLAEVAKETTEQAVQLDSEAETLRLGGMGLAADIEVDPITAELQAKGVGGGGRQGLPPQGRACCESLCQAGQHPWPV